MYFSCKRFLFLATPPSIIMGAFLGVAAWPSFLDDVRCAKRQKKRQASPHPHRQDGGTCWLCSWVTVARANVDSCQKRGTAIETWQGLHDALWKVLEVGPRKDEGSDASIEYWKALSAACGGGPRPVDEGKQAQESPLCTCLKHMRIRTIPRGRWEATLTSLPTCPTSQRGLLCHGRKHNYSSVVPPLVVDPHASSTPLPVPRAPVASDALIENRTPQTGAGPQAQEGSVLLSVRDWARFLASGNRKRPPPDHKGGHGVALTCRYNYRGAGDVVVPRVRMKNSHGDTKPGNLWVDVPLQTLLLGPTESSAGGIIGDGAADANPDVTGVVVVEDATKLSDEARMTHENHVKKWLQEVDDVGRTCEVSQKSFLEHLVLVDPENSKFRAELLAVEFQSLLIPIITPTNFDGIGGGGDVDYENEDEENCVVPEKVVGGVPAEEMEALESEAMLAATDLVEKSGLRQSIVTNGLQIDPGSADLWFFLGMADSLVADAPKVAASFVRALALDPYHRMSPTMWLSLGEILAKSEGGELTDLFESDYGRRLGSRVNNWTSAKQCFVNALESPYFRDEKLGTQVDAWYRLGQEVGGLSKVSVSPYTGGAYYYHRGSSYKDVDCYVKALEIDPTHAKTWRALAETGKSARIPDEFHGNYVNAEKAKALADLLDPEVIMSGHSSDANAWRTLGELIGDSWRRTSGVDDIRRREKAKNRTKKKQINCYVKALDIDPNHAGIWYDLGTLGGVAGRWTKEWCFARVIEIFESSDDPKCPEHYKSDAWHQLHYLGGGTVNGKTYHADECLRLYKEGPHKYISID